MPAAEETIFHKLGEIPVVNDGWTSARDYYFKIKDFNSLTRLSCRLAESSVKTAGKLSTPLLSPVISKYQSQIDTVNGYACQKLDEIESRYPLIKQPSNEVMESCTEYVQPVLVSVKPVVNQVQGILETGKRRAYQMKTCSTNAVIGMKTRSTNAVIGVKDVGVNTVTNVVLATFETTPVRFVTASIDKMVDRADAVVDRYLPENENETENEKSTEAAGDTEAIKLLQKKHPTPDRVAIHLKNVLVKLHHRILTICDLKARLETVNSLNKVYCTIQLTVQDRTIAVRSLVQDQVISRIPLLENIVTELSSFTRTPIIKSEEYFEVIKSYLPVSYVEINMNEMNLQDNDLTIEQAISSNNNSEDELEREDNHLNSTNQSQSDENADDTLD